MRFPISSVLVAAGAFAGTACASGPAVQSRPEVAAQGSVRELSADAQALHVLNRLAFGARPNEVERVKAVGVDRWMEQQLHPSRVPDATLERSLASYSTLDKQASELLQAYPPPGLVAAARTAGPESAADSVRRQQAARASRRFVGELLSARVARAVESERQLQEVMTDFWLNHFSVFVGKNQLRYYLPEYERDAIRPHVFGKFRELLGAVAHSPAMLVYLDNAQSVADSGRETQGQRTVARRGGRTRSRPAARRMQELQAQRARVAPGNARSPGINENYARELLELHTLGVDGGYSQQDVIEVARALTGWSIQPPRLGGDGFRFNAFAHDAEPKTVLGVHLAGGRGIEDGEQVLDILARHPSTAQHIARKLAVRLVSDTPPQSLVDRAAATFRRTDGDIREVVRTIVFSPEFHSRDAYRAKVKSSFEFVVSAVRALGGRADSTPLTSLIISRLGQTLYGHQAPDGWPEVGDAWMNTGAILNRINFGMTVASNRVPGARATSWPRYEALREAPREQQVEEVVDALLGGQASPETRDILRSGVNPLASREGPQPAFDMVDPDEDATPRARVRRPAAASPAGLAQIIGLALGSPEFQRR
ncbi:MAG: DUF1800 domain-containing protein [Gemmatimonadaceae bacterium]